jgi:hypothetical protein
MRPRGKLRLTAGGAIVSLWLASPGCSSSPCNVSYNCSTGETCWTTDGQSFDCFAAGSLERGATCASTPGPPLCGEGLACVANGDPSAGVCLYWCDSDLACPMGTCTTLTDSNGVSISFCLTAELTDAGGMDGGSAPDLYAPDNTGESDGSTSGVVEGGDTSAAEGAQDSPRDVSKGS